MKLDSSVTNAEISINGYSIISSDRNGNVGGVACYIRNDLCFNIKNIFSNSIEHVFFRNSHTKSLTYWNQNILQTSKCNYFLDIFSKISSKLVTKLVRYIFLETLLSTYFKTVNHNILLKKMEFVQFSEETKKWLKSYLPNGKFKVHIKNTFSEPGNLLQGSILGPLLFLLYINDMPQAVDRKLLLYADDTCLIFQHKDINEILKH